MLNRLDKNKASCAVLRNLLQQLSQSRVCIDSGLSINLTIKGSEREFNRCVNSLSSALKGAQISTLQSMEGHSTPCTIAKVLAPYVSLELRHLA